MVRVLGAPVTEAQGNSARSTSTKGRSLRASTVETIWCTVG